MEKIKSFTIDHMTLLPGVYLSRLDTVSAHEAFDPYRSAPVSHDGLDEKTVYPISTYDIRITRPNFEPVMTTAEIHAIEHIGATYLRNRRDIAHRVIYWGPMGCRTGFYLIMAGDIPLENITELMKEIFAYIASFDGDIPGATPKECGNYSDMDLPAAKKRASAYIEILEKKI